MYTGGVSCGSSLAAGVVDVGCASVGVCSAAANVDVNEAKSSKDKVFLINMLEPVICWADIAR